MMEAVLKSKSAVESDSGSKTSLITSLAKMMNGPPPRPPTSKKPDITTTSQKGENSSANERQSVPKPRLSKAKDTLSQMSQVSEKQSDMAKRMLYEKRDLKIKNQMLQQSLGKLQLKYNKLKDRYMQLKNKYVQGKKSSYNQLKNFEMSQDIMNESMPQDDTPAVKIKEPQPENKLSKSFVLNQTSQPQLEQLLEFATRQPSQMDNINLFRSERKPTTLQLPIITQPLMDWSNGFMMSPLVDIRRVLEDQNKQLRQQVESLKAQLKQLRQTKEQSNITVTETTQLKSELARTSSRLYSEYEKLMRIKEIVKDIGIDFAPTNGEPNVNNQIQKQKAQGLVKDYFSSLDI